MIAVVGLLARVAVLTAGCVHLGGGTKQGPDFTGRVTDKQTVAAGNVVGTVMVEAEVETEEGIFFDKYVLTVTGQTALLQRKNGEAQRVGFDALAVGQTVQVWFTGPLKESYPVHVDAKQIVILG
jgi:hypothetical protein